MEIIQVSIVRSFATHRKVLLLDIQDDAKVFLSGVSSHAAQKMLPMYYNGHAIRFI